MPVFPRLSMLIIAVAIFIPPYSASAQAHSRRIASRPAPIRKVARTNPAVVIDTELRAAIERSPKASQWPDENFASILDTAEIEVRPDGTTAAEYRLAFRLYNERARDLAEVSLPFNDGYQKVEVLSARTIRKNGSVLPVSKEDIRTQSPFSEYLMYDDSKTVGFSMPGVEDDCVIDYRWRVTTRPFINGHFSESWTFSEVYPVGLSRLAIRAPVDKPFQYRVYNNERLKPLATLSADGKTRTLVWEMRDIAPMEQEPDMPEMTDVHTWIEISSLRDWQEMARWYDGLMKPQTAANTSLRRTVQELTAGKKTDEEKARALYDFAANRVRYVGLEFGISAFKPHAAAAVHEKLYGDCKDKATLLITMLGMAGIRSYPALLMAETARPTRLQLPTLEAFNHCIAVAEIGGRDVWLDATAETCEFGDVPGGDRGSDAFVIRNGVGRFSKIPVYSETDNTIDSRSAMTVRPDRGGEMDLAVTFSGASAQEWRSYARSLTPDKRRELLMRMVPPGGTLKSYSMPDGADKSGPYTLKMVLEMKRIARKTGNLLLLGMPAVVGSSQRNPYTSEKRKWPIVNRQASQSRSVTTIALPEGFDIEEMPEPLTIAGPLAQFHYRAEKSTDGRTVTVTVDRVTHAGSIPASDYAKVRAYYDQMLEAQEDQMIVVRKAG